MPDIAGLAWRMPPQQSGPAWDVLLASTLGGNRFVLWPARSWGGVTLSTVMPMRFEGTLWWLRARLRTEFGGGLRVDAAGNQLRSGEIEFDIEQSPATGRFEPVATLSLTEARRDADVSFDPALNQAAGVRLAPDWLSAVRRAAYRRSRVGRGAE